MDEQEAYWRKYAEINNYPPDNWQTYMNEYFASVQAPAVDVPEEAQEEIVKAQQDALRQEQEEMEKRLKEYNKHVELQANPELAAKEEEARAKKAQKMNQKKNRGKKRKAESKPDEPKKEAANPHVWVTGLPEDVTVEEIAGIFKKCGMLRIDEETGEPKIKLYYKDDGACTGEARVTYYRVESVDLALKFLHEDTVRGHTITVERATFSFLATADPSAPPQKKAKQQKKKKKKKIFDQTRDLAWDLSAEAGRHLPTTVIVKGVFVAKDFEDPNFYDELKEDLEPEFNRYGAVQRFTIFDTNEEGVVSAHYVEHEGAKECRKAMDGRFFAGRQLQAEFWDGVTKYKVPESEALREARLKAFGDWLARDESDDDEPTKKKKKKEKKEKDADDQEEGDEAPAGAAERKAAEAEEGADDEEPMWASDDDDSSSVDSAAMEEAEAAIAAARAADEGT